MLASDFQGQKIYLAPAEGKRTNKDGTPRDPRKLGRVHFPVFTKDGSQLVGFMITPPEIAGMVKRPDRFAAFDRIHIYEGALAVTDARDSFDQAAAKRLGIDLDACVIWTGMDVVSASGETLGYCADACFSPKTRAVEYFAVTRGATASALLGDVHVPACMVAGYRSGCMVVDDAATALEVTGGVAAKAGEATAVVGEKLKQGAQALDEKGSVAVTKGARAVGRQLGRTRGMFGAFKDEFKKAAGAPGGKQVKKKR